MKRLLCCASLVLLCPPPARAQESQFKIRGDTSGTPRGCSARAGIAAISNWFVALNAADSAKLDDATAPRFVFSISSRRTRIHSFFSAYDLPTLLRYARKRSVVHEHIRIQEVKFNRWRGRGLQFGPIYFMRSADDLGPKPLPGIGKGEVVCGEGIHVLNVADRPDFDPGPEP